MVGMPLVLLVLGFPIFLVLLATSATVLVFFSDDPATVIHQVMFGSIDKFALLAVPFFIFAGELMSRGGVSIRLINWVASIIGSVRGSLPLTAVGTDGKPLGGTCMTDRGDRRRGGLADL